MSRAHYELKKVMQLRFAEMQAKNPQYSLRAFAKSLDVHAASLSEFFNNKRQFSPKLQKKIIEKLTIAPDKKHRLMTLVSADEVGEINMERIQLDTDSYEIVKEPIYYSLLCLIETHDFKENYKWMAKRLKTTEDKVIEALERLERVGYIRRLDDGKIILETDVHIMPTDDVANMSLRLRHSENLDNAKDALLNLPLDERYFRFETLAIDKEQMPEFKKAAAEFFNKMVYLSQQSDKKSEVYEFCFNFFPRSN